MQNVLEVKNLSFGYKKDKLLFDDFSFSVKKGELKAIVGESGTGKSTLFELILKNIKPKNGEISHSRVSQVFQDPYSSFHPSYTILNQMQDVADCSNLNEYLQNADLEYNLVKKLPHELSGGQLQRMSIIRALMMEPELLLLDEPTSALDNIIQINIMKMLIKNLKNTAILIITHDEDLAYWCADEIIKLS